MNRLSVQFFELVSQDVLQIAMHVAWADLSQVALHNVLQFDLQAALKIMLSMLAGWFQMFVLSRLVYLTTSYHVFVSCRTLLHDIVSYVYLISS